MKNIWQLKALYNGSLGIVRGLMFKENTSLPSRPYCILVEFDDFRGPSAVENLNRYIVPIVPETVQFDA